MIEAGRVPGRGEVGGDEEEVAGGADDEGAPGPHPPHHRGTHRRERRERGVEQRQRQRAQVLVLLRTVKRECQRCPGDRSTTDCQTRMSQGTMAILHHEACLIVTIPLFVLLRNIFQQRL
jgi:hypothetical protein